MLLYTLIYNNSWFHGDKIREKLLHSLGCRATAEVEDSERGALLGRPDSWSSASFRAAMSISTSYDARRQVFLPARELGDRLTEAVGCWSWMAAC